MIRGAHETLLLARPARPGLDTLAMSSVCDGAPSHTAAGSEFNGAGVLSRRMGCGSGCWPGRSTQAQTRSATDVLIQKQEDVVLPSAAAEIDETVTVG